MIHLTRYLLCLAAVSSFDGPLRLTAKQLKCLVRAIRTCGKSVAVRTGEYT